MFLNERKTDTCGEVLTRPSLSHPFTPIWSRLHDVRPLHDRIIVQRIDEGEQNVGGIIIPDTAKKKPQQGTVISAGNGKVKNDRKRIPLDVKAGDRILFGKYAVPGDQAGWRGVPHHERG